MTVIISDASPIHYLALIAETNILPALYGRVIIQRRVFEELQHPNTPNVVQAFAASAPSDLKSALSASRNSFHHKPQPVIAPNPDHTLCSAV